MLTSNTATEMTVDELDGLLAEQLPARELMTGGCRCGDSYHGGDTNQFGILSQQADDGSQNNLLTVNVG